MKHRSNVVAARFALRGVALAAACLWAGQAGALGLGRLSVNSALGETLKAEIDITSITPEEAASLVLRVAPPDAYRAAGVDYNAVLQSAKVQLLRRSDGRSYLRLSSDRAVIEPFVDVIIEANWSSGRLVRDYTMLFDPPATRTAQAAAPAAAPVVSTPVAPTSGRSSPTPAPMAAADPRPAPAPAPAAAARRAAAQPAAASKRQDEITVKSGDTLFGIASRTQPSGISLDQMLVSLFRGNPQAFMGDNMNRLKAGAVLTVPTAEQAAGVSAGDARTMIVAQSADFDAYRQRLAGNTRTSPNPATDPTPARQASGKVQAQVDDRRLAAATTPDKLTLSQGKASAPEAAVSRDNEKRDNAARLAELARNVDELKRLQSGTAPAGAAPSLATASAPAAAPGLGPTVVAAAPPAPPAPTPEVAPPVASPAAPGSAPAAANPAPTPPVVAAAPTPTATPPVGDADGSSGLLDSLLGNPLVLPGAGALVLLLLGFALWRMRSRNRFPAGETSFLESRLQPDSFFGASGGQRIDTRDAAASSTGGESSSSMSYSLSQLDAIGDVDPVAEADVYLAYGRDLQAEEILKEALRSSPDRMAVRSKLLEVYAKRRDLASYELLATQMHNLTQGEGAEWAQAQAMGLTIDPENPLYAPGGQPDEVRDARGQVVREPLGASTLPFTAPVVEPGFQPAADATLDGPEASDSHIDLELDPTDSGPMPLHETTQAFATDVQTEDGNGLRPDRAGPASSHGGLDFDLESLDTLSPSEAADTGPGEEPLLDFGDLTTQTDPTLADGAPAAGEPMARKLELAEEFRQIGDIEGARDLLEEVVARSDGALKAKAQGMLDRLA